MLKKGLYDQANLLLSQSFQISKLAQDKNEFEWDFYSTTAKVKLKKLEVTCELQDRACLLEALVANRQDLEIDSLLLDHRKLCVLFDNEFKKHKDAIKESHISVKF
jgi:hypothetical protein